MNKISQFLPFTNRQQQEQSCFPSLSFTERLIAFGICCGLGYLIQILSFGSFLSIVTGNPTKFAIVYSIGNILSLAGTGFLIGFKRQFENMKDKDRRISSIVFIAALIFTIISAVALQSRILVFICLIVQISAYIWYTASYIPYGRQCLKNCFRSIIRRN